MKERRDVPESLSETFTKLGGFIDENVPKLEVVSQLLPS